MSIRLDELAKRIEGRLEGDGRTVIDGPAGLEEAEQGQITFLSNPKYAPLLNSTGASAVILAAGAPRPEKLAAIICDNPYAAYARTLAIFDTRRPVPPKGMHAQACVSKNARMGKNVSVGAFTVIEDGAAVGDGTVIFSLCYIGPNVRIGRNCLVWPQVTVREDCVLGDRVIIHPGCVIGSDGFGYAPVGNKRIKIPQIGAVELGDDVELGACVTIDRATTGKTSIGRGTKIDNLCQVAHNVKIGEDCVMAAQTGISGSTKVGNRVVMAGQVGLVGHINIGDDVTLAAKSGIHKDVPAGKVMFGYPAREHADARRMYAALARLPQMHEEFVRMKKQIENIIGGKGNV